MQTGAEARSDGRTPGCLPESCETGRAAGSWRSEVTCTTMDSLRLSDADDVTALICARVVRVWGMVFG